jgi:hypothetical protein
MPDLIDVLLKADTETALAQLEGHVFGSYEEAADIAVAILNREYCMLNEGGKIAPAAWPIEPKHPDDGQVLQLHLIKPEELKRLYANRKLLYTTGGENPRTIPVNPVNLWEAHAERRTRYGVTFTPGDPGRQLNLFFGYAVEPAEGDWSLLERLITEGVCGNEPEPEEAAHELLSLLAWKAQHIDQLPEKAVVLRGGKGAGKNTVLNALERALGATYCRVVSNREHVFGRFNSHLQQIAVLGLNEAFWRGDHREEATLKMLVTERQLPIERKFGAVTQARNCMLLMMLANADWVVPASLDERRFAVYDVADTFRNDRKFFRQLHAQLENGGHAAFLYDLLNWDLGKWHPRDMVDTGALRHQKTQSLEPHQAWLFDLVHNPNDEGRFGEFTIDRLRLEPMPGVPAANGATGLERWESERMVLGSRDQLYGCYVHWCRTSLGSRGEILSKQQWTQAMHNWVGGKRKLLVPDRVGAERRRVWTCASLENMRDALEEDLGG